MRYRKLLALVIMGILGLIFAPPAQAQEDEPTNVVLQTDSDDCRAAGNAYCVPVCSERMNTRWQEAWNYQMGVIGNNPGGQRIDWFPAYSTVPTVEQNWYPVNSYKQTLCGQLYDFRFYRPGEIKWYEVWEVDEKEWWGVTFGGLADEADWNNFIIPNPHFAYLITDFQAFQNLQNSPPGSVIDAWPACDSRHPLGPNFCVEAEITPPEDFYENRWFRASTEVSVREGLELCAYGPWVREEAHGNKPEIHPSELYWWRQDNGSYYLFLIQDDSNRFDRAANYSPFGNYDARRGLYSGDYTNPEEAAAAIAPRWRPWSAYPLTGQFWIAFEANLQDDPIIFDMYVEAQRNVSTSRDSWARSDADDGTSHALEYNGDLVVIASEHLADQSLGHDQSLGVEFRGICRDENNTRLQGYVAIKAVVGRDTVSPEGDALSGDRGGEGYLVLRVDKRQIPVTRKRVKVTFDSVRQTYLPYSSNPSLRFSVEGETVLYDLSSSGGTPNPSFTFDEFLSSETLDISVYPICCIPNVRGLVARYPGEELRSGEYTGQITYHRQCPPRGCDTLPDNWQQELTRYEIHYRIDVEDINPPAPPEPIISEPLEQPDVSLQPGILSDSFHQVSSSGQNQLVVDIGVRALNLSDDSDATLALSSAAVQTEDGEIQSLTLRTVSSPVPDTAQNTLLEDVPLPIGHAAALVIQTTTGETVTFDLPALALTAMITNEVLLSSVESNAVQANSPISFVPARQWRYEVAPTYVAFRNGTPSPEDDSPITGELNETIGTQSAEQLEEIFGTTQPITVEWSFSAVNWATGDPVPVRINEQPQPGEVQVMLSPTTVPNGRVEVSFPESSTTAVIELVASVKVTDVFGAVGETQHLLWNQISVPGDFQGEGISDTLSVVASLSGLSLESVPELSLGDDLADQSEDAQARHLRILHTATAQAIADNRMTFGELDNLNEIATDLPNRAPEDEPQLDYATYLGGGGDDGGIDNIQARFLDMTVDDKGNIYLTGWTSDKLPGATESCLGLIGLGDAFVTKINADGTLAYSTCLAGSGKDGGLGIAVDKAGNAYVVGGTRSGIDFPTKDGFDSTYNGHDDNGHDDRGEYFYGDAFIAKLDANGVISAASYLGGSGVDVARSVAIDDGGDVYVIGEMESFAPMPGVPGYDIDHNGSTDIFIAKLDADLSTFKYFTFLGGDEAETAAGIAVDSQGAAYVIGCVQAAKLPRRCQSIPSSAQRESIFLPDHIYGNVGGADVLVAKLNSSGTELEYSTILAGSSDDLGYAIAIDEDGNTYVTGATASTDFPVTDQAYDKTLALAGWDAFVTKLDTNGEQIYTTYLGGTGQNIGNDIAVDLQGNVYVTGISGRAFPVTTGDIRQCWNDYSNAFFTVLEPGGSQLRHSTCIGGNGRTHGMSVALGPNGAIYLAGATEADKLTSINATRVGRLPGISDLQQANAGDADVFVVRWIQLPSE